MATVPPLPPRPNPRVTFSTIAEVLSSPAHRLPSILKPHKYPKPGPVFGYKKAREQLVGYFVDGTPLNPGNQMRDHEVDALNTASAFPGFPDCLLPVGATNASAPTPANAQTWTVSGVEISFFPDLLLEGTVGKKSAPATGAVKFYFRKDPLSVGPQLSALLYYHRAHVVGDTAVDPSLCGITDVQSGIVYTATGSYQRMVTQVEQACQVIASIWPNL